MNHWLEAFAYRINISWLFFLIAGIITITVSFLTISIHAINAALANPVNTLRSD
jgi:putative ABC transport system permease protein